jgi:hypothetical protein
VTKLMVKGISVDPRRGSAAPDLGSGLRVAACLHSRSWGLCDVRRLDSVKVGSRECTDSGEVEKARGRAAVGASVACLSSTSLLSRKAWSAHASTFCDMSR